MTFKKIPDQIKHLCHYQEKTWEEVREKVKTVNPVLADIIDEFKPSDKHTFIKASYPFGQPIRSKGLLYLPTADNNLATLDNPAASPVIVNKLGYSPSPLALITEKSVEIYVETPEERTVPFKLFKPGVIFGVWEVMEQPAIIMRRSWEWSISAGARTIFMLPKISDSAGHLKLQRAFNLRSYAPNNIFEHHKIFTEIFHHHAKKSDWATELLFFTKDWLKPMPDNIGWVKLKEYWTQVAWNQVQYWFNKMVTDFNWESFIAEVTKRRLKIRPYLLDTVKHLISIGCGTVPGFITADDSQLVAPTEIFQEAYINHYQLKNYAPIIMHPDFLWPQSQRKSVYYSLQAPTLPEKPPEHMILPSLLSIVRELKKLMDIYIEVLDELPKTAFFNNSYDFSEKIKFDYFHPEPDKFKEIKSIKNLLQFDAVLRNTPKKYEKKPFPENASFFKGCIRITFDTDQVN